MPLVPFITGAVVSFLYGITIGSFLNVCIYRLPIGLSLSTPPSHCPSCRTRLRPIDLFPLFSYLGLGRKCRYCHTRISPRYFTIELITGLLFVACWWSMAARDGAVAWTTPGWLMVIALWVFAASMLVTFMIDLDTTLVFDAVTWVGAGAGIAFELIQKLSHGIPIAYRIGDLTISYLPAAVPGMVIGFAVFVAMDLFGRLIFRKPGMGLGDAFIGAAIGAMLGPGAALLSFGIAVVLAAVVGIVLTVAGVLKPMSAPGTEASTPPGPPLSAKKSKKGKRQAQPAPSPAATMEDEDAPQGRYMPFGPFLTASAMAVALAPEWFVSGALRLWHWWLYQNPMAS